MKKIFGILIFAFCLFINIGDAKAATIKDGVYKIQSALSNDKVIDVKKAGAINGTNIQLYGFNGTSAQKWHIKHVGNDYYTITSDLANNKVMDVQSAGNKNGTNVQLYSFNNTNAQKWLIKYAGDGYYYIVSKCNGLYVDVKGGKMIDGTNIQMYKGNGTKAQKFKFIEILNGTKTIEDGTYTISSMLNENKTIDIKGGLVTSGTNVQLYDLNDNWAQIWNVKYLNDGYYSLTSYLDKNKSLDVNGAGFKNGTNIQIYQANNTNAQKWILKKNDDDSYSIVSKIDNMYVDISGAKSNNGTNVQLYHGNDSNAQKFKFNKIEVQNLKEGFYKISGYKDNTQLLSMNNNADNINYDLSLETNDDTNSQKWYVKNLGKGYYTISSATDTIKTIDNRAMISQRNNSESQKMYIKYAGDGSYNIVAKSGNLYMDSATPKVTMTAKNNLDSQKFIFTETTLSESDALYDEGYYTIQSALNSNMVLDVQAAKKKNGTNVQLYSINNSNAQIWKIKKLDNGYYSITSAMNPETSLDLNNGNIQLNKYTGSNNQLWKLTDIGDGYIRISSKQNNSVIKAATNNVVNSTNVEAGVIDYSNMQKFKLTKVTEPKIYTGIDISHHQKSIDWEALSNSDLGFVIIRAGYGDSYGGAQDDKTFKTNVAACEKYNIPYGIYLYSYAESVDGTTHSAVTEANHMLELIKWLGVNKYTPDLETKVFYDVEDSSQIGLGKEQITNIIDKFCSTIESNGYSCGLYANNKWLTTYMDAPYLQKKYEIWLAEWLTIPNPTFTYAKTQKPSYNLTPYKYWQFASDGIISGVSGNTDLDLGYDIFD